MELRQATHLTPFSIKIGEEPKKYEVRIHANMELIFEILEKPNTKATFFCLGWIAETYPKIIKEIVNRRPAKHGSNR